jgi:hypothetical protein
MATDLTITLNVFGPDGSWTSQDEIFTLVNLAPLNTRTVTSVTGRWNSSSIYLGSDYSGSYYAARDLSESERLLASGILSPSGQIVDPFLPVGFFFDSAEEAPFMVLEGFEPQKLFFGGPANVRSGVGHLGRSGMETSLKSFGLHWKAPG